MTLESNTITNYNQKITMQISQLLQILSFTAAASAVTGTCTHLLFPSGEWGGGPKPD